MTEKTSHAPGTFCWVELGTSDAAAAKKFYGGLFGWRAEDVPGSPDVAYTLLKLDGKDVAGLYGLTAEMKKLGVPPHWLSYVAVENTDASTKKAASLGAKIAKEPFDVMDVGRMALLQDPTGAMFALWQAKSHVGVGKVQEPGSLAWNELLTKDTKAASAFYTGLFGWGTRPVPMAEGSTYTVFTKGEAQTGGMMEIGKDWGSVPPNWVVYFAVQDCDASAQKAKTLGAEVLMPPTDIPNVGRFAMLQDPQRAVFAIIKFTM